MPIDPGWPCALLPALPPAVADRLSEPSAEELLPQVLAVTPRGPAWGTDEAGDGSGASPLMRRVWTAVSGWMGDLYAASYQAALQTFPSAVTFSLPDWEAEYGLPDTCLSPVSGTAGRIAALRVRFGARGGASPAYFICLAASIGFEITIDEPTQFICDESECADTVDDETDEVSEENVFHYWVVKVGARGETWFYADEGRCDDDPLEGFIPAFDLECLLRRVAPTHTTLVFNYGTDGITADSALPVNTEGVLASGAQIF